MATIEERVADLEQHEKLFDERLNRHSDRIKNLENIGSTVEVLSKEVKGMKHLQTALEQEQRKSRKIIYSLFAFVIGLLIYIASQNASVAGDIAKIAITAGSKMI